MSRIRFVTARDLFDTYPAALSEINVEPTDQPSLEFLKSLIADDTLDQAIGFCAYLLPRREAVWWGCQCVRLLLPHRPKNQDDGLRLAEDWVREPDENRRLPALDYGRKGDRRSATTWLTLAVGWSDGGMMPQLPDSPHATFNQTASAVRAAVLMGACYTNVSQRKPGLTRCAQGGARFAAGEELQM